ncbi:MAG: fimbrillin family protein [Candidatus Cryptobacteroides sp.]
MKKNIYWAAALMLLAIGCNKNSEELSGIPIRLSVSLEGETKATHQNTDNINELDFIIRDLINSSYSYSNTRFTPKGNIWEPESQMLWHSHLTTADILCISPCLSDRDVWITNDTSSPLFTWEIESVQTADSYASDLLLSVQKNSSPNITINSGALGIRFSHAMSLLTINVELGTEFNLPSIPTSSPIESVTVGGLKLKGDYYSVLKSGVIWDGVKLVPQAGSEGDIQTYAKSWTPATITEDHCTAVYECIILPQEGSGLELKVRTANKEFGFTPTISAGFAFEAGKSYVINLKAGKNYASLNSVTVFDWNTGAYISYKETD